MAYRDELAGLQARLRRLEAERAEIIEKSDALRSAARRIDRARIAAPCSAKWANMRGDEQKRFCRLCRKHVYNAASFTGAQLDELLRGADGSLCMRLFRRPDGTVLTADCPVGVKARRRRRIVASALLGVGAGVAAAALATRPTMGIVVNSTHRPHRRLPVVQSSATTEDIQHAFGDDTQEVVGAVAPEQRAESPVVEQ